MPRALILRDMRNDRPVSIDRIVRRDLASGVRKLIDHFLKSAQDRRVQNNRIDNDTVRPGIEIRRSM